MRRLIYLTASLVLVSLVGCEKYALDRQMAELCKKDGGLKVYETVTLPRSAFDPTGRVIRKDVFDASQPLAYYGVVSGGEYLINSVQTNIVGGEVGTGFVKKGRLSRFEHSVLRVADKKILGLEVSYGRTGGEWSLHHPGSSHCPIPSPSPGLENTVFKQEK